MGFICPLTGWQTQSHQQLSASVIGCTSFTAFSFTVYCARCWPCESLWMGSSNQMPVGCAYEANVSCQWAISSVYCLLFVVKLPNNWNCWSTGSACPCSATPVAWLPACLSGALWPFCLTFSPILCLTISFPNYKIAWNWTVSGSNWTSAYNLLPGLDTFWCVSVCEGGRKGKGT